MYKHTFNSGNAKGQSFHMPSQTIQGQTLSIAQMLQRIQNGIPVDIRNMEYGEDEEPQPRITDLTDIDEMSMIVSETQRKLDFAKKEYEKAKLLKLESSSEPEVILSKAAGASEG
jgi:hypothetical protein